MDLVKEADGRIQKAFEHLNEELKSIRTGRATPILVENISVDVYGQTMSLKQVASINTPDVKTLTITPWDPSNLAAIEAAIKADKNLGMNPNNDGKSLHLNIPPLTAERREVLVRQVGEKVEEANIVIRNIRHDILQSAKAAQDDKQISEDDYHKTEKELTAKIEEWKKRIESTADTKRAEISTI